MKGPKGVIYWSISESIIDNTINIIKMVVIFGGISLF
jgi:hypothetical protein